MSRLPDHLNPPAIIETLTRFECPKCGNNCSCGVPYVPKTVRAAEYAAQNPTASVREIAKQTGVGHGTAQRAKESVPRGTPTKGGTMSDTGPTEQALVDHAYKTLTKLVHLLRQMNQRERLQFRTDALQRMGDAYLDRNIIEY